MNMLHILKNIVLLLNEPLKYQKLYQGILQQCIAHSPAESGALYIQNEETGEYICKARIPEKKPDTRKDKLCFSLHEGISAIANANRQIYYTPDITTNSRYKKLRTDTSIVSQAAVPLLYNNEILGILCLDSTQADAFSSEVLDNFDLIGKMSAPIIQHASLYHSLKQSHQYRETLIEIGHILTEGFDLKILFHKVMERLARQMDIKIGILSLLSEKEADLSIEVAWGLKESEADKGSYKLGEGITGMVAQQGKAVGVKDIHNEPSFLGKTGYLGRLEHDRQYCFICVPLLISNQVRGTLSITKEYRNRQIYESDKEFMELVSATIAKSVYIHLLFSREKKRLLLENRQLKNQLHKRFGLKNILAASPQIKIILEQLEQVAETNATVLLRGESGTGKELFAHAIHYNSPRCENPFVKINCGALPDSLLESELFGYVKGAFTGAVKNRDGKFLTADGGTIFLDEIGNTSPLMQVKLLRVLQEKSFEPVGSDKTITVDVRIIAATNHNLEEMVKNNTFREDLFYRLNVVPVFIPPLRERKEDIPVLTDYFIKRFARHYEKDIEGIEPQAMKILTGYRWPGNVRELENCIEYGIIFERGRFLTVDSLKKPELYSASAIPRETTSSRQKEPAETTECLFQKISPQEPQKLRQIISTVEKDIILKTLEMFDWNKSRSAKYLGINRLTLSDRIKKYKLESLSK